MNFFFNDTATTEIYTLSLHDALPISARLPRRLAQAERPAAHGRRRGGEALRFGDGAPPDRGSRSEEHTSELQSQSNLVCRLLLEKKKVAHGSHQVPGELAVQQPRKER